LGREVVCLMGGRGSRKRPASLARGAGVRPELHPRFRAFRAASPPGIGCTKAILRRLRTAATVSLWHSFGPGDEPTLSNRIMAAWGVSEYSKQGAKRKPRERIVPRLWRRTILGHPTERSRAGLTCGAPNGACEAGQEWARRAVPLRLQRQGGRRYFWPASEPEKSLSTPTTWPCRVPGMSVSRSTSPVVASAIVT